MSAGHSTPGTKDFQFDNTYKPKDSKCSGKEEDNQERKWNGAKKFHATVTHIPKSVVHVEQR